MLPIVLMLSNLLASVWAMTAPAPWALGAYFKAQFLSACGFGIYLAVSPNSSGAYVLLFTFVTGLILGFVLCIAWESLEVCSKLVRRVAIGEGVFFGVLFSALTAYGIWHDFGRIDEFLWLPIVQSLFLTMAGIVMATTVPFSRGQTRVVAATLAILWLAQAGFGYMFSLFLHHSPVWYRMNNWLPTMILVPALFWLGWRLRESA
jgi:hypothetical protein